MTQFAQGHLVGIDWGTTHRRVYALDPAGVCTRTYADEAGALSCKGRFASALETALARISAIPDRVLMSGMVGSALGWQEIPYVDARVALTDLPRHAVRIDEQSEPGPKRLIIPGYCVRNALGQPDVMRGEETQLLGACALGHDTGWFVLPGTHSKWVQLQAGHIAQLRTYMTGELFNLLGAHGTLAAASATPQSWDEAAFVQGLRASGQSALSHQLFGCRARVVSGDLPASSAKAYLSGLLIGSEFNDVVRAGGDGLRSTQVYCLGAEELAQHYLAAAAHFDVAVELVDSQAAYIAALAHFQTCWNHP